MHKAPGARSPGAPEPVAAPRSEDRSPRLSEERRELGMPRRRIALAQADQQIESTDPEDIEVVDDATLEALKQQAQKAAKEADKQRRAAEDAEKKEGLPTLPGMDKKPGATGASDEVQKQIYEMRSLT